MAGYFVETEGIRGIISILGWLAIIAMVSVHMLSLSRAASKQPKGSEQDNDNPTRNVGDASVLKDDRGQTRVSDSGGYQAGNDMSQQKKDSSRENKNP